MRELARDILAGWPSSCGIGKPLLGLEAAEVLMECVANTTGDYAEIGSAWGGSAVMAGMAMEAVGRPGLIVCVDPFDQKSEMEGTDKKLDQFWKMMIHYGIQQRVLAFKQYHPPFPLAAYYHMYSVSLIDGNHHENGPADDFNALTKRTTNYILFDNAEIIDVTHVIDQVLKETDWEEYKRVKYRSPFYKEEKWNTFVAFRRISENIKAST